MVKLMDVNFNDLGPLNKIKSYLSNQLKCDLKSIIEYEFE